MEAQTLTRRHEGGRHAARGTAAKCQGRGAATSTTNQSTVDARTFLGAAVLLSLEAALRRKGVWL